MDVCLRMLKESNKSRFDTYSVRNSVLIISQITFRDCREHFFLTTFLEIAVWENRPWHFLCCRFSVLFGGNFVLPFTGPCLQDFLVFSLSRAKEVIYASPRIFSSVQNKEPPAHFKKRFCLFLTLQKVTMV